MESKNYIKRIAQSIKARILGLLEALKVIEKTNKVTVFVYDEETGRWPTQELDGPVTTEELDERYGPGYWKI